MTILVTGAAGLIGSNLCQMLLEKKYEIYGIDNFITGKQENIESQKKEKRYHFFENDILSFDFSILPPVDIIFHLASPASPDKYKQYPVETLMVNSLGTKKVLDYMMKSKSKSFVYASTSEVYGDPLIHPQNEEYWGNVNPNGLRSCYDEAKRFGEAITMTYVRKYSLNLRIARIFNTYGPNMEKNDGRVVSNFINQAIRNKPITVYGNGNQTRSFCYVSDMIEGLYLLGSKKNISGSIVNLGSTDERKVIDLARMIQKMTQTTSAIEFRSVAQDDPQRRKPDIQKAKHILSWEPRVSLETGLEKTIQYFEALMT